MKKKLVTSYRKKTMWWPLFVGIGALIVSFFLVIALGTHYQYDPSWFFTTTDDVLVSNKSGIIGAHISALLIYLFGGAALLLIPLLFFIAYIALRYYDFSYHIDALCAAVIGTLGCAALASSYGAPLFADTLPGGVIGAGLAKLGSYLCDEYVFQIFCILVVCASLVIATHFSIVYYLYKTLRAMFSRPVRSFVYRSMRASAIGCYWAYKKSAVFCRRWYEKLYGDTYISATVAPDFEDVVHKEYHDVMHATAFPKKDNALSDASDESDSFIDYPHDNHTPASTGMRADHDVQTDEACASAVQEYRLPQPGVVDERKQTATDKAAQHADEGRAKTLEEKLARFGIMGKVVSIKKGPVVTLFEYQPDIDTKISKILALEDDLALALQALSIRIIAPIPGRSVVGFEVANKYRSSVSLSALIQSPSFTDFDGNLPIVLGVDTVGEPVIVDLMSMPHLLVAGATGSGKSVGLNTMLVSLLYKLKPSEMRLILIDPKRLEFASYADIAHLLFPIVTHMKDVVSILRWLVGTMEERYTIMAQCGVRHVLDYQKKAARDSNLEPMPFIVIMIDEFSDLLMTTGKDVEDLIVRIAQMARAAGIHMIIATQRPSVDVITGLIKVNFPSRVAFRVTSKVDSRTILDVGGAEKLLGKGDMLFLHAQAHLARVHGAYISDNEIYELVLYIKKEQPVRYLDLQQVAPSEVDSLQDEDAVLFKEVCLYLETVDEISISLLQRKFRIGYNRSARIMEQLEMHGLILSSDGSKMRKVVHSR